MHQPDSLERARQELALHIALGGPLMATNGYASPEVADSNARAHALADQVGDTEQRFTVRYREWAYHTVGGRTQDSRALGEAFLRHAECEGDPALILVGHRLLGTTCNIVGAFPAAHAHLKQTLALYDAAQHRTLAFRFAQDPQIACQTGLAQALWQLGYPEQAIRVSHDALANAQALGHINTLCFTLLFCSATLAVFCQQAGDISRHTRALMALSEEQGLALWRSYATVLDGWVQTLHGHAAQGLARMAEGLVATQATGAGVFRPFLLSLLAQAHAAYGQALDGVRVLDEASTLVDAQGERFWEAEIYRLKGELTATCDVQKGTGGVEECLQQALSIARRQQAKSLELRTATSLARLWKSQGKRQAAYDLLVPVYGWFTEGFDTADLQEAKALLDSLRE